MNVHHVTESVVSAAKELNVCALFPYARLSWTDVAFDAAGRLHCVAVQSIPC